MPRIDFELKLDFKDVLLRPKRSTLKSRADVDLIRELEFCYSKKKYSGVPIIASNMDTVGTFETAIELAKLKLFTTIHKHYTVSEWETFIQQINNNSDILKHIAISGGLSDSDFDKIKIICNKFPEIETICLDVANGYSECFVNFIRKVREEFPTNTIFAGNVVTGEMVEQLILSGADVVKIGIGPGSVCTTRKKTGVGYPQLSAVLECADAAHGLKGHVISDGGCLNSGDIAKAFGAGADFVMIGGLFAGHDQSGGEIIIKDNKKYKLFYGMSSETAMKKHHGSVSEYRASEGKTIIIPYRGDINLTVKDLLGGIRSACTYTGANKIKELPKRATFIRVNQQANEIYTANEIN